MDKYIVIDMAKWNKETKTVGTSSEKGNYLIKTVCQYICNQKRDVFGEWRCLTEFHTWLKEKDHAHKCTIGF